MSSVVTQRSRIHAVVHTCLLTLTVAASVRAQEAAAPPPNAGPPPLAAFDTAPPLASETPRGVVEAEPAPELPGQTPAPEATSDVSDWTKHVKIGGGGTLWYYQPLQEHADNRLEFFNIRLEVDATLGPFGVHLEPRVRDSKLRPYYDGPAWIQEAYGSWAPNKQLTVKVGKTYSRLGLFWDNSFYGNVQVYDGLKLSPDYGASIEGKFGNRSGLSFWAQYFLLDGQTNVSLPGRDTFSIASSRRRNEGVLNLEPFFKLGEDGLLKVGVSGQVLRADLPGPNQTVLRAALHAKLTWRGFGAWAELLHQKGRHVNAFPIVAVPATDNTGAVPGRASGKNDYLLLGAEYTWQRLTLRYNVSYGQYHDVDVSEWLHVPSITVKIADSLSVLTELVFWQRHTPEGSVRVDRSLNVLLLANF